MMTLIMSVETGDRVSAIERRDGIVECAIANDGGTIQLMFPSLSIYQEFIKGAQLVLSEGARRMRDS